MLGGAATGRLPVTGSSAQQAKTIVIEGASAETDSAATGVRVLNIGGEGEIPGAVNLNRLEGNLRRVETIKKAGPLVKGDFTASPFASGSMDEVVGNRLPFIHGDWARRSVAEAYRVLKPGGRISLHASSGGGDVWIEYLKEAGFKEVQVTGGKAVGVR
jgi:SAM-dependent methyltransferase